MLKKLFRKEVYAAKAYVPGKPIEDLKRELNINKIEKLASNENPLGPSPKAMEYIEKEIKNINMYPDSAAIKLREKLSEKHGVKIENIVVGSGGEELIKNIAETFINPGDEVMIATPTFGKYATDVSFLGGVVVNIPLNKEYKQDVEKIIESVNEKTKLIFICNPNNPTGNIMTKSEQEYLIKNLPQDVVVVFDEAYYDYAIKNDEYPETLNVLKERPNTIILRTFSKVAGIAAVRLGYLLTSQEICEAMYKIKLTFSVNRLAQAAALGALEDKEHIDKTVELNYKSLALMEEYFDKNKFEYIKSNANFIFVNVNMDSKIVFQKLLEKGVIIRGGFLWGWNNWIRVSTGTIDQTKIFIDRLEELVKN
ncbi:histidinol-phosphate transaminase [Clostridium scatologenes]|uniref:Histidinol-phosphate aminotransferase n=1 Tax=Clostridium scatologenes TaxID=1548 RepID=A0A0E3M6X5_CLOSL|nr:histidinol-phosphate transaminase [Clostridium scatologenes]AKA69728.1 histidinol-phosphate aminotransferase [Clostridium scatologenes]